MIFCPFHNNTRTPAAEINKYSGMLFCFSCQKTADLIEVVMQISGRTYFEAIRFIKGKEVEVDILSDISSKLAEKEEWVELDSDIIIKLHSQALIGQRAIDYFSKRNITLDSVKKFKLGYSEIQDMVTIPIHNHENTCVGFVGRSIEGKVFKNTSRLPKSKVLFNLNRNKASSKIYVVESSFDAIRLDQVGMPAVATLGANVSSKQIDLLQRYFNDIIIIADNDEAGGNMIERIVEKLGSKVTVIKLDKQYKDIGDMDDMSIKNLDSQFDKSIVSMLK
jgi:DNA primase